MTFTSSNWDTEELAQNLVITPTDDDDNIDHSGWIYHGHGDVIGMVWNLCGTSMP